MFSKAIKLIKNETDLETETVLTIFNTSDIVIYPSKPIISYIEKGILLVRLIDDKSSWQYKLPSSYEWENGYGSTILLAPGIYKKGSIWIRSVIDDGVVSSYLSNVTDFVVSDNNYHTNEIDENTWEIDTVLTKPAYKNDMVLNVFSNFKSNSFSASFLLQ